MKQVIINQNEKTEFQNIIDLLQSNDLESVKLAIGFIELYPKQMTSVRMNGTYFNFSSHLGLLLYQYKIVSNWYFKTGDYSSEEAFWRGSLILFFKNILCHKIYYV